MEKEIIFEDGVAEAKLMKIGKIQCARCGKDQWIAILIGSGKLELRCRLCGEEEPSVEVEIESMKLKYVHFQELSGADSQSGGSPISKP